MQMLSVTVTAYVKYQCESSQFSNFCITFKCYTFVF